MWDPVAELTRAFLTELKIGVTAFIIVGRPQCFHVVTTQGLPRGDARVDTHKSTAECIDLEGLFYFLLCFYSILYRLSSTTTCQMSHNSGFIDKWYCCCYCYGGSFFFFLWTIHGGSCVTIHIFFRWTAPFTPLKFIGTTCYDLIILEI